MLALAERSEVAEAAADRAAGGDTLDLECTIEELARIVGRSDRMIRKDIVERGAPVLEHGKNGVGYKISVRDYQRWRRAEEAREEAETEARIRTAAQLRLEFAGSDGAAAQADPRLSPAAQKTALEAELLFNRAKKDRLELVYAELVAGAIAELGRDLVDRATRLPDEVLRVIGGDEALRGALELVVDAYLEDVRERVARFGLDDESLVAAA